MNKEQIYDKYLPEMNDHKGKFIYYNRKSDKFGVVPERTAITNDRAASLRGMEKLENSSTFMGWVDDIGFIDNGETIESMLDSITELELKEDIINLFKLNKKEEKWTPKNGEIVDCNLNGNFWLSRTFVGMDGDKFVCKFVGGYLLCKYVAPYKSKTSHTELSGKINDCDLIEDETGHVERRFLMYYFEKLMLHFEKHRNEITDVTELEKLKLQENKIKEFLKNTMNELRI